MADNSYITVKSSWDHEIENSLLTHSPKSASIAILFPGSDGCCEGPLMHFSRMAAFLSGCDVLSLEYGYRRTAELFKYGFRDRITGETREAVEKCLNAGYANIYFISKSFGTAIAGELSISLKHNNIKNLFLTPPYYTMPYITELKCTVVTGTNDVLFSMEHIDKLKAMPSIDLHIIDNATHSLEIEDDWKESLNILTTVTTLCSSFVSCEN